MMKRKEITSEIIELQRRVDKDRRQYELDAWMDLPITIAQLKSLFFIRNQGSTSLGKLAAALGVTPTNTTGIVDRLVKQGLVTRAENEQDRRVLVVRLTPKGESLISNLRQRKRTHVAGLLEGMADEELDALARGLRALVKAVEAEQKEPLPV